MRYKHTAKKQSHRLKPEWQMLELSNSSLEVSMIMVLEILLEMVKTDDISRK